MDNFLLEGDVYIFKVALGILKMYEIDLRFSSFSISLKYLTEPSKNFNEEFLFDTIECINVKNYFIYSLLLLYFLTKIDQSGGFFKILLGP